MGILVMELDVIEDEVFSFPSSGFGQNVLISGVDMSFSDILIIRKKTY